MKLNYFLLLLMIVICSCKVSKRTTQSTTTITSIEPSAVLVKLPEDTLSGAYSIDDLGELLATSDTNQIIYSRYDKRIGYNLRKVSPKQFQIEAITPAFDTVVPVNKTTTVTSSQKVEEKETSNLASGFFWLLIIIALICLMWRIMKLLKNPI